MPNTSRATWTELDRTVLRRIRDGASVTYVSRSRMARLIAEGFVVAAPGGRYRLTLAGSFEASMPIATRSPPLATGRRNARLLTKRIMASPSDRRANLYEFPP